MNNSKYTRIGDENEESESKNDCVTDIVIKLREAQNS